MPATLFNEKYLVKHTQSTHNPYLKTYFTIPSKSNYVTESIALNARFGD